MDPFLALLLVLMLWGPSLGQEPNSRCYLVDQAMAQRRPCRVEEVR